MKLTLEQIEEGERLLAKATPNPWNTVGDRSANMSGVHAGPHTRDDSYLLFTLVNDPHDDGPMGDGGLLPETVAQWKSDAIFVVWLINNSPALLAAARAALPVDTPSQPHLKENPITDKTEPLNTNKLRDHVAYLANNALGLSMVEWDKVSNAILQAASELDATRTERNIERAARIKAEAELKELREALNKIATMRKIGATPKFIKGEIIEEIERIALGALITPSEGR